MVRRSPSVAAREDEPLLHSSKSSNPSPLPRPGPYGLLTQTLSASPCTRWILPARVRSPLNNDIVFVGHTSVQLKEFSNNGHLSDTLATLDLGIPILAGRVISAPQHIAPMEDQILEGGRDEVRFTVKGQPCADTQPPQIVVLSLASHDLAYLYARRSAEGPVRFVWAKRRLLGSVKKAEKKCDLLAVDPECRALAITDTKDTFSIQPLKEVDEIKSYIDGWSPQTRQELRTLPEQRFVEVDGLILRMEFLKSTESEPDKVILLLVVACAGQTRLYLYQWDAKQSLRSLKGMRCSGQLLPPEDSFPLLVIPSSRLTSFALVTKSKMIFYDEISSRQAKRVAIDIPGALSSDQIWVQWAKPPRHAEHKKEKEDIFLIREDGLLRTFLVNYNSASRVAANFAPGHLGVQIDTAVCMLAGPPMMGGDILIAAGEMGEGGVFHLQAREVPMRLQTLPNSSPIQDIVVLDRRVPKATTHHHSGIIMSTGTAKGQGSIAETQYGLEARVTETIVHPESKTVDNIWALERVTEEQLLLLASHHEHTTMIVFDLREQELEFADAGSFPGIDFDAPTLASASLPGGVLVQITSRHVNAIPPSFRNIARLGTRSDQAYVAADIEGFSGLFAVISRQANHSDLLIGIVGGAAGGTAEISTVPHELATDALPVLVTLSDIGGCKVCVVALQDGSLRCYRIDEHGMLELLDTISVRDLANLEAEASFSALKILSVRDSNEALLACGLKNGVMIISKMKLAQEAGRWTLSTTTEHAELIGNTSVSIKPSHSSKRVSSEDALLLCGSELRQLTLYKNDEGLDFTMNNIWLSKGDETSREEPVVMALDKIPTLQSVSDGSGSMLICATEAELVVVTLSDESQILRRKMSDVYRPKHMVYSSYLKRLIVATEDVVSEKADSNKIVHSKSPRPTLELLEVDSDQVPPRSPTPRQRVVCGERRERIKALLTWTPTDGKSHFEMIVIGIEAKKDGRLAYLNATKLMKSNAAVKARQIAQYAGSPIHALCPFGLSSLVVCAGRVLKLLHLDIGSRKFHHRAEADLPSPASSVQAQGSFIFAATIHHSIVVLREQADGRLQVIGSDRWAGRARSILSVSDNLMLLNIVSASGSRILGFRDKPSRNALPHFEAQLPVSIDHLVHLRSLTPQGDRHRFLGCSLDGTWYLLTTINQEECDLLKYLESLISPAEVHLSREWRPVQQRSATGRPRVTDKLRWDVSPNQSRHARGDVLRSLLQARHDLHSLMVKSEVTEKGYEPSESKQTHLRRLALPLTGEVANVEDAVVLWLRKMLNVPTI